ncbi:MAG: YihY/virulence factor BrkB family protein [Parvibaculaceae bacterium]
MTDQRPSLTRLLLEAIRRLFADEAIPLAGNIAFRFLFSIFPFLIFLTALAGFFGSAELAARIVTYLLSVAPKEFVGPIAPEISSLLTHPRTGLLSVSAIITVWSAMGGVDSVRVALNRAYGLTEDRNAFLLYGLMALFVVGSAFLLLALAVLIVFAPTAIHFINAYAPGFDDLIAVFDRYRYPLAIVILVVGLFLAHLILPARRVKIYYLMPGVLLTVAVWLVLSSVYSYFLANFATFASTYVGLSGLFAAMFLIYLSALALILGGELNRVIVLARKYQKPSAEAADLSKE